MSSGRNGFEWGGRFYPWHVSDIGKDLMLIDRIAQMPMAEFLDEVADVEDTDRAPILLGLIATSIRSGNPDWSVGKIERAVLAMSMRDDVEFVYEDDDDEAAVLPPSVTPSPSAEPGKSASNVSSLPSIPPADSTSAELSGTRP